MLTLSETILSKIERLQEYRTALMTAAVAGRINLRKSVRWEPSLKEPLKSFALRWKPAAFKGTWQDDGKGKHTFSQFRERSFKLVAI